MPPVAVRRAGCAIFTALRRSRTSLFIFARRSTSRCSRILSGRPKLKYYEAGMDLGLSYDRAESFRLFQARILEEYDKMVDSDNFVVLDGTLPVNKLQKQMRDIVASKIDLKRFAPHAPESGVSMPDQEKEKDKVATTAEPAATPAVGTVTADATPAAKAAVAPEDDSAQHFLWRAAGRVRSQRNHRQPDRDRGHGRLRTFDADRAAAGVAGVGRVRGADQRIASLESCGTRHRRIAGEKRGDAPDPLADVRDGFLRPGRASHFAGAALRHGGAGGPLYLHA